MKTARGTFHDDDPGRSASCGWSLTRGWTTTDSQGRSVSQSKTRGWAISGPSVEYVQAEKRRLDLRRLAVILEDEHWTLDELAELIEEDKRGRADGGR